jgi:ABC-type spermidine/putrescine transport system permease subunit II
MRRSHPQRTSPILAWVCAVAALVSALAVPISAGAVTSSNFQQELLAPPKETTTAAKTTTAEQAASSSSGVSGLLIFALVAGGLLLGGIAFVIVRDARSVAPVTEGVPSGGTRNPEARLRKRRARAKAARQQRKKNR